MSKSLHETNPALGCVVLLLLLPCSSFADAYVLMRLWGWFVVPQFHVAPLSLAVAIGLDAMWLLFRTMPGKQTKEQLAEWQIRDSVLPIIMKPGTALAIGYLAHLAMS